MRFSIACLTALMMCVFVAGAFAGGQLPDTDPIGEPQPSGGQSAQTQDQQQVTGVDGFDTLLAIGDFGWFLRIVGTLAL